jgi:hypothetical protein
MLRMLRMSNVTSFVAGSSRRQWDLNFFVDKITALRLELKTELAQKERQIKETAKQMLLDGMPVEKVAQYTGLAEKEVKALMHYPPG